MRRHDLTKNRTCWGCYLNFSISKSTVDGRGPHAQRPVNFMIKGRSPVRKNFRWTSTDSIYGSRALAKDWENKVNKFDQYISFHLYSSRFDSALFTYTCQAFQHKGVGGNHLDRSIANLFAIPLLFYSVILIVHINICDI